MCECVGIKWSQLQINNIIGLNRWHYKTIAAGSSLKTKSKKPKILFRNLRLRLHDRLSTKALAHRSEHKSMLRGVQPTPEATSAENDRRCIQTDGRLSVSALKGRLASWAARWLHWGRRLQGWRLCWLTKFMGRENLFFSATFLIDL